MVEEEEVDGDRKKEASVVERSSYCFWGFSFGVDSIFEEVVRFSPLWFPQGKYLCSFSYVFD